jgi:hypothetical protein
MKILKIFHYRTIMKSTHCIVILILLCFWLWYDHRNPKHQDSFSIPATTNEKVFYSDFGFLAP